MSPPRKKEKIEVVAGHPADDSNSGVIRFEIEKPFEMDEDDYGDFSDEIVVGGMPWRARISRYKPEIDWEADAYEEEGFHFIYLHNMHKQLTPWLVEATVEYSVLSDESDPKQGPHSYTFSHESENVNLCLDYEIPYELKEAKLVVEIRFTILSKKGFRTAPEFDFTDPNDPRHDVALVINGEKIYVSKQILATHSPVFKAMFYGEFDEKGKKEIDLPDVDREEFVELLHVIYPCNKKITEESVEYILKLADRFQIEYAIERAEAVLVNSIFVATEKKLRLADQYRLFGLKYHVFSGFNTKQDLEKVKRWTIYRNLSDATKAELSEKIAEAN